jgi:hypothetical protein
MATDIMKIINTAFASIYDYLGKNPDKHDILLEKLMIRLKKIEDSKILDVDIFAKKYELEIIVTLIYNPNDIIYNYTNKKYSNKNKIIYLNLKQIKSPNDCSKLID